MGCRTVVGWGVHCLGVVLVCLGLAGCGGGGGGGSAASTSGSGSTSSGSTAPSGSAGTFSVNLNGTTRTTTEVAGTPATLPFNVILDYTGSSNLYLVGDVDQTLVSAVNGTVGGTTLSLTLTLLGSLAPGSYNSNVILHACLDQACTKEAAGSPALIPFSFTVYPNIAVQSSVSLQRTGNAAAPTATLAVSAPAAAGALTVRTTDPNGVFQATLTGSTLSIATVQARTGIYTAQITLTGSQDTRFTQTVTATYVVAPPAGGEQPLSVTPYQSSLVVPQGGNQSTVLTVSPPTWTNVLNAPVLNDATAMLSLTALGNNQYQVNVNANGAAIGSYAGSVSFTAGPTGGTVTATIAWQVVSSIYPANTLQLSIDATTTASALALSSPINSVTGQPVGWTASTTTPWITLTTASGISGGAPLALQFDPNFFRNNPGNFSGSITLTPSQAGASPLTVPVSVTSSLPLVQSGPAVLNGTSGTLYFQGSFVPDLVQLQSLGALQVTGATVTAVSYRTDQRFLSIVQELVVSVSHAVPGTPIVVSIQTPLASSQVSVPVQAPVAVSAGYLALPYGSYRPAGFASGRNIFYFGAPDTGFAWAEASGQRTLIQTSVPGLSGLAVRPDEQYVYGVAGSSVVRLDPVTLLQNGQSGPLTDDIIVRQGQTAVFDASVPAQSASLCFAADARAFASVDVVLGSLSIFRSANWINTPPLDSATDLITAPNVDDLGTGPWGVPDLPYGIALVASPNHFAVAGTTQAGTVAVYQASQANWGVAPPVTAGIAVVGLSDDATRLVRSDGTVVDGSGTAIGNLSAVVPLTQQAGGFALTEDGHYGLVYGYQVNPVNGAQPATNGTLTVVDLSQAPAVPLASSAVVATVALPSPVGCTSSTLATGETCAHSASITVTPGSASVFILGPRGVVSVPLPSTLAPPASFAARLQALRSRLAPTTRLQRPVGTLLHP